jgi:hypothetical protein
LGFENAEFYIKRWPELDGMRFGDVLISFPDAVPCGVKLASKGGKILMNPADDYVLREGDEVLVIAEDDDTYAPAPLAEVIFLSSTSGCIICTLLVQTIIKQTSHTAQVKISISPQFLSDQYNFLVGA